ncbi:MAG: hypothetical protein ACM3ML_08800 [Micromonosporaceae bacterium]
MYTRAVPVRRETTSIALPAALPKRIASFVPSAVSAMLGVPPTKPRRGTRRLISGEGDRTTVLPGCSGTAA